MVKQFYVGVPSWVRWALVALGLYLFLAICVYPYTPSAEYKRSNELDEVRGGQVQLVVPAETGIHSSNMSPDGRWLIWNSLTSRTDTQGQRVLMDLVDGETYDITNIDWTGNSRWVNTNQLLVHKGYDYQLVQLPEMRTTKLNVIKDELTDEELKERFSSFADLVAFEGFSQTNSAMALIAFDANPPLVYPQGLSTNRIQSLSLDVQIIDVPWANHKEPHMSPDGRYYTQFSSEMCCAFHVIDSQTGEEVAFVRRDGRYARILGWSPDSISVYFKFEVGGASGGILHPYEPVFKLVLDAPQSGVAPLPNSHVQGGETAVPFWLLPLIGMGSLALLYYRPNWIKATRIGGVILLLMALSITSCIAVGPGPNFDPEALDVQGGQLEIVIPAEHYISEAQVSPDGQWLYYGYRDGHNGEASVALLNIPQNTLYEGFVSPIGGGIWLDGNHLSAERSIWRLSDMVVMPKVVVHIESIEEGKALLEGATQLFFVQGSSRYSIQSTDPDYPYTIRFRPTELGCKVGSDNTPCVEAMLSEGQTYTLTERRDVPNEPVYSPDGQYYVQRGRYPDDPTHSLGGQGDQLFQTDTNELLVYGYRYGWNASFLGWAHDSSGAYILYRPRSAMGDLTRSQYPIRKYLVPGAEARGLPTVISPAATPRWLPTPNVTPPAP